VSPAPRRRGAAIAALVLAMAPAIAGCLRPEVVRVVDGEEIPGDFVTPDAYASYARAAIAEREGRLSDAARDYARAAGDSGDPAAYARLGATLCAMGHVEAAQDAFADGLARDERAAVVLRERARCALSKGDADLAITSAREAVRLDPGDHQSVDVLAQALAEGGRAADARVLLAEARARGLAVRSDVDAPGADVRRAQRGATAGGAALDSTLARPGSDLAPALRTARPALAEVDAALARGDLEAAALRATEARLGRADLAARALALGHRAFAADVARRVLAADPSSATAWCVAVASDDAAASDAALRDRLAKLPSGAPSGLASLLYAEVLLRRGGPDAVAPWVAAGSLDHPRADPLEERVRQRLAASLAARR
jgi:Tfp pilus assembly protein PilF